MALAGVFVAETVLPLLVVLPAISPLFTTVWVLGTGYAMAGGRT